jgi:hypothetical protein
MGIGSQIGKVDCPPDITQVNKMKVYGINYQNNPTFPYKEIWEKIERKCADVVNRHIHMWIRETTRTGNPVESRRRLLTIQFQLTGFTEKSVNGS